MDAQYKQEMFTADGNRSDLGNMLYSLNMFFTIIFAFELVLNLFANWFLRFIKNGWNVLDFVIVFMSMLDFGLIDFPDWLVRLMRALRIVRLFGRVKELRKMFSAISASIFPMMNAFVILVIILSICRYHFVSTRIVSVFAPDA